MALGRDELQSVPGGVGQALHGDITQEREGARDPTEHGEGMTRKMKDLLKIYLEKIEE